MAVLHLSDADPGGAEVLQGHHPSVRARRPLRAGRQDGDGQDGRDEGGSCGRSRRGLRGIRSSQSWIRASRSGLQGTRRLQGARQGRPRTAGPARRNRSLLHVWRDRRGGRPRRRHAGRDRRKPEVRRGQSGTPHGTRMGALRTSEVSCHDPRAGRSHGSAVPDRFRRSDASRSEREGQGPQGGEENPGSLRHGRNTRRSGRLRQAENHRPAGGRLPQVRKKARPRQGRPRAAGPAGRRSRLLHVRRRRSGDHHDGARGLHLPAEGAGILRQGPVDQLLAPRRRPDSAAQGRRRPPEGARPAAAPDGRAAEQEQTHDEGRRCDRLALRLPRPDARAGGDGLEQDVQGLRQREEGGAWLRRQVRLQDEADRGPRTGVRRGDGGDRRPHGRRRVPDVPSGAPAASVGGRRDRGCR